MLLSKTITFWQITLSVIYLLILSSCGGGGGSSGTSTNINNNLPTDTKTLVSVKVTANSTTVIPSGATLQLKATATYSDCTTTDVTNTAAWSSSDTAVATVNTDGLVQSANSGSATITAKYTDSTGSASGNTLVTITDATVTSVAISPSSITVPAGFYHRVTLTGTLSDGQTVDLTLDPNTIWQTSDSTTAQVIESTTTQFPQGVVVVYGESQGNAAITASYKNSQENTLLSTANTTVDSAQLESIEIQGQSVVNTRESTTYMAIGYFNDGTSYVLNNLDSTLFSSSNPNIISIESHSGVATGGSISYVNESTSITVNYRDNSGNKATATLPVSLMQSNQWSEEINSNFTASEYAIAVDSNDNPILLYIDKNTSVAMASIYKNGNWYSLDNPTESSTSSVSAGNKASSPAMTIDHASGDIVYVDYTATSNNYANVKKLYLESANPAWLTMQSNINNFDSNAQISSNTITLDSNYMPYIGFHEHKSHPKLSVLKWSGMYFSDRYDMVNGSAAYDLNLAIVKASGSNTVYLSYLQNGNSNFIVNSDYNSWAGPYTLSSNEVSFNSAVGFYTESVPYVTFEDTTNSGMSDTIELYNALTKTKIGLVTFPATSTMAAQNNITLSEQHTDKPVISYIDNYGYVQVVFYPNVTGVPNTLQNLGSSPVATPAESNVYSNPKVAVGANIGWVAYQNKSGQIILKKINHPFN